MSSSPDEISREEILRGNALISSFESLSLSEGTRYMSQASQLIELGSLEIFRGDCKFHYEISESYLLFHVNRLSNNTSVSGKFPLPHSTEEIIPKILTLFAHSEAVSAD